ncbi:IS4 family transposase, partial [Pseudomonas syringae pv. pisi]
SPFRGSEMRLAETFLGQIPDNSITLFDKGFWGADLLLSVVGGGANRHWLTPARKNLVMEEVERYGEHDRLVRMKVSPQARKRNPELPLS